MSFFKKPIFWVAAIVLLTLSSCDMFSDDDDDDDKDGDYTYDTAIADVNYLVGANRSIFFDFSTGDMTKVSHDIWDIAISTSGASIIANSGDYGSGVVVYKSISNTIAADLSGNESDIDEYTFKDGTELYGTQDNANPFENEISSSTALGTGIVYLVKDEAGIYYKVVFNSFEPGGTYSIDVVTGLGASTSTNNISGGVNADYGYIYFDLGTAAAVTVAPKKSEWDILFTRTNEWAAAAARLNGRSDVLLNLTGNVEAGMAEGSAVDAVNGVSEVTLSGVIDIIGHSWYYTDGMPPTYLMNTNTYVVKTTEGNYGKFQPGSFYGPDSEQFYMTFRYYYQGDGSTSFTH